MWSIADRAKRRGAANLFAVLGASALIIAGCGFRPLYGESSSGNSTALATIAIDPIADRSGQKLRNLLLDKLSPKGPPSRPLYRLTVSLNEGKQELAIKKDETATRANLTVTAGFTLLAVDYPQLGSLSGVASSINSYNVLQSDYATLSAENDARNRALEGLAEEIRLRVAAGLRNPRLFTPPDPQVAR